jgi:hypothetical protein
MNRADIEFNVGYSCRLEKMTASLWGRVDKLLSLVQVCLGASAFTEIANLHVIGCTIVVLSVYSLVYQPGSKGALAELQKRQYESLSARMHGLSDDELAAQYAKVQECDSPEIGALCDVAYNGELIRLGQPPKHVLSLREKAMAWMAGDLPRA